MHCKYGDGGNDVRCHFNMLFSSCVNTNIEHIYKFSSIAFFICTLVIFHLVYTQLCTLSYCRCPENEITIYPADVVLFEGILVFYFPAIRELFHMKLFVDTDSDTRLARRGNYISGTKGYFSRVIALRCFFLCYSIFEDIRYSCQIYMHKHIHIFYYNSMQCRGTSMREAETWIRCSTNI